MRNLGVSPLLQPKVQRVVAWERTGGGRNDGARLLNNGHLQQVITSLTADGIEASLYQFHKKPMREQLEMIRSTTVLITPAGAGSHIAFFLPRGATAVRLYRGNFMLEWHIFNYLAYIHVDHVSCPRGDIPIESVLALAREGVRRYDTFRAEQMDAESIAAGDATTSSGESSDMPLLRKSLSTSIESVGEAVAAVSAPVLTARTRALPPLALVGPKKVESFKNLCVKAQGIKWATKNVGGMIRLRTAFEKLRNVRITRRSGKLSCHTSQGTNFGESDFGCNVTGPSLRTESTLALLLTKGGCSSNDATIVLPNTRRVEGFTPLHTHSPFYLLDSYVYICLPRDRPRALLSMCRSMRVGAHPPPPLPTHIHSYEYATTNSAQTIEWRIKEDRGLDGFHGEGSQWMKLDAGEYCLLYSEVQSRISGDNTGTACYDVEFIGEG